MPASYFVDIGKLILKFVWKCERPRIDNTMLKQKKDKIGELTLPDFRLYYKGTE